MKKEKFLQTEGWAGTKGSTRGPHGPKKGLIAVYF